MSEQEQERDVAAELDALASQADDSEEWQPGADPEPEQGGPDPKAVEAVQALVTVTFGVMAARKGQHWMLSDDEAKALAEPAAECLEKYAPDMAVGPEATLLIATGMVVVPRLLTDREIEAQRIKYLQEQQRKQEKEREQSEGGAGEQDRPEPTE